MSDGESEVEDLPESEVVRRVAFDIGSNATKLQVADVDTSSGCICNVVFEEEVPCSFGVDWKQSKDGLLSNRMQDRGLQVLHMLCKSAVDKGGIRAATIATEVFRKAGNGEAYLQRVKAEVGLTASIVTQEQEGRLGFLAAAGLSGIPRHTLVSWDCGGASFQICREAVTEGGAPSSSSSPPLLLFLAPLGVSVVTAACVEQVQKKDFATVPTPNPVAPAEAEELMAHVRSLLPAVPDWLQGCEGVVAIGGPNSMFRLATEIVGALEGSVPALSFTPAQVRKALGAVIGRSEADLTAAYCNRELADPASFVVPKMALLLAVMDACQLPRVTFQPAVGSCAGILVSNELYLEDQ